MRSHYIAFLASSLILFSCGGNSENKENSKTPTPVYQVHDANPAWASEELNDRASPAKSISHEIKEDKGYLQMALHYSAPSVKGRTIWDSLVVYDEVWRTGANEANMIEFSNDVHIQDQHIQAGAYSLFSVPKKNGWTVILNSVSDQWGHYEYSEDSDVARFELPDVTTDFTESLLFEFKATENADQGLYFSWENRGFVLPISLADDVDNI